MKVMLRNPDREVEVAGGRPVLAVLEELGIPADTVLVIRAGELITRETRLSDDDRVEIRPVISGGAISGGVISGGAIPRGAISGGAP